MTPEAQATLQEIVGIARDGREFYEYAAYVVDEPTLRERFERLARAKSDVVALAASRLSTLAEPEPSRREFRAGVRATLTRIRGALAKEQAALTLAELDRLEEHLIYHYTWVLAGTGDDDTRRELRNLLPVLQRSRDELAGSPLRALEPAAREQHREGPA